MRNTPKTRSRQRTGHYTYDDFCTLIQEHQKADLLDGVIYMASPENTDANDLFVWLIRLVGDFVDVKDLGRVFGSRVACRLDEKNAPEPDLLFVSKNRLDAVHRGGIDGPADLAIEIVSPDSVERDYEQKRRKYERAGFHEYWIIDEELKAVTLLRLDSKGRYREVKPRKGILESSVLSGFWLRIKWLWQETRPSKIDALAEILGE